MTAGRGAGADGYEAAVLDFFWQRADAGHDRLELLRALAEISVERPDTWRVERVRQDSAAVSHHIDKIACFCCRHRDRAIDVHHVVQVHLGGSATLRNMVPLCRRCHGLVHPHLRVDSAEGWTRLSEILNNVTINKKQETA
jgi:5-methylcytosine-specific restriction endonuclease McrA